MSNPLKKYSKPALKPSDIIAHIAGRGLIIPDPASAEAAIAAIGYYRLLIYMRPLQTAAKVFSPNTTFDDVLSLYDLDRRLRLLCLDAIERVEVALRAAFVNELAVGLGPHFYTERRHFERVDVFDDFLRTASRAKYPAVAHYRDTYNDPSLPPIWVVTEAVTFGELSRLFSGLHLHHRKSIAKAFAYDEKVLVSWFRALSGLRNKCAHHNRVWNAAMTADQPMIAKALASEFTDTRAFQARAAVLTALTRSIDRNATWHHELVRLIRARSGADQTAMGFVPGWSSRPFWS